MYRRVAVLILFTLLVPSGAFSSATKGDVTFTPKNASPVLFSHDYHIKTRGVKCAACHFRTFAASHSVDGFQMNKAKMTKRDFCGHCHNGLKGFDAASEKNCSRCHKK